MIERMWVVVIKLLALIGGVLSVSSVAQADHHWAKLRPYYVIEENGKCGYIDDKGNYIVKAKYDRGYAFNEGLASVTVGYDTHFINPRGEIVFSLADRARSFGFDERDGLAKVETRTGDGFIDKTGKFVVPPVLYDARPFGDREKMPAEVLGKGFVLIDRNARVHFGPFPGRMSLRPDGVISVWDSGRKAAIYFDAQYERLPNYEPPPIDTSARDSGKFQRVNVFHDSGFAKAQKLGTKNYSENWGVIDRELNWVVPPIYDDLYFNEGPNELTFIHGSRDKKWGFVDISGGEVIPFEFEKVLPFVGKHAPASQNGKWGLIDKRGGWSLRPEYDQVSELSDVAVAVQKGSLWGVVDYEGNWILEPRFRDVGYCQGRSFSWAEHTFREESSNEAEIESKMLGEMLRVLDETEAKAEDQKK